MNSDFAVTPKSGKDGAILLKGGILYCASLIYLWTFLWRPRLARFS